MLDHREGYFADLDEETRWLGQRYRSDPTGTAQALLEHLRRVQSALNDARKDAERIDWLSDPAQDIGRLMLPSECVQHHLDSLRGAIDEAMTHG